MLNAVQLSPYGCDLLSHYGEFGQNYLSDGSASIQPVYNDVLKAEAVLVLAVGQMLSCTQALAAHAILVNLEIVPFDDFGCGFTYGVGSQDRTVE
jgi:hypothetical protein